MRADCTDQERTRGGRERAHVTFVELFYDLVFVSAVTQLSQHLLQHLSPEGVAQTVLLFAAVWWAWTLTAWMTNWLNPEQTPVRIVLLALMLAGLVLSASLPRAFHERAMAFATAYVVIQFGRSLFMAWAGSRIDAGVARIGRQMLAWLAVSSCVWLVGAFADPGPRLASWSVALAIEYFALWTGFWIPWVGRVTPEEWRVDASYMTRRLGLFVIIALGESILVTGATFAQSAWTPGAVWGFATAFVGSVAMWWLYFDPASSVVRVASTYVHVLLVGGIVVAAVGDKMVLSHPGDPGDVVASAVLLTGPALYLFGNLLFKRANAGRWPASHIVGLALLAAEVPMASSLPPLSVASSTTLVLVMAGAWETVVGHLRAANHRSRANHLPP